MGAPLTPKPRSPRPAGVGRSRRKVFLTAGPGAAKGAEWEDLWNLRKPSSILTEPGDSGFRFHRGVGPEPPRLTSPRSLFPAASDNTTQALTQTRTPQSPCPVEKAPHQAPGLQRGKQTAPATDNGRLGRSCGLAAAGDRGPPAHAQKSPCVCAPLSPSRALGLSRLLPARLPPSLPGFPGDGRKWRTEAAHEARRKRLPRATSCRLSQTALVGDREAPEVVPGGRSHGDAAATRR